MGQSLAESRDLQALAADLEGLASLLAEGSETALRAHLPDRAIAAQLIHVWDSFEAARAGLAREAEAAGESAESVLAITSIEELQATAQRLAERRQARRAEPGGDERPLGNDERLAMACLTG